MCCFAGDTQIKLANGEYKCIKDVQVGDEIKGSKGKNKVKKVYKPFLHFRKKYSINDGKFFATAEHPFKTTEGWKAIKPYKRWWDPETWDNWFHDHKDLKDISELKVGDTIITEKGQTKIKKISSNWNPLNWFENVYNLQLDNDNTYYANDYLVHNKICFVAGTKVLMADGTQKNIETIEIDDKVVSWNEETKELAPASVIKLFQPIHDDLVTIEWEHGTTTNTFDHPFWDQENDCWMSYKPELTMQRYNFKNVRPLTEGSTGTYLSGNDPVKSQVKKITEKLERTQTYIFELDKNNTFFANGILTHNKGGIGGLIGSIIGGIKKVVGKVFNAITSPFGVNVDVPDYDIGVDMESHISGALVTKDSAVANIPVVYGKRMVGATRVFVEAGTGDQAKFLYVAYVLCEGPINGVTKVMLDDKDTGITAGQLTHGAEVSPSGSVKAYNNRVKLQFFDGRNNKNGTGAQVSSSLLRGINTGSWTNNHKLEGLAYIAARYEWIEGTTQEEVNANPFLGNVPNLIAEIEGKKVFDAKTLSGSHSTAYDSETITYTNNPVSCLLDYMRNPVYGKGLTNDDFNYSTWKTAADLCDQTVSYTNYSNTKAFSTNYVLDTGVSLMSNTKILAAAFRGIMPYQGGKYQLKIEHGGDDTDIVATPSSPTTVMTVNNDHIVGGMTIDGENKLSKVNRVAITYVNPDEDYQPDQVYFPEANSSLDQSMLAQDNNIRLEKRISVPFCTSKAQAEQYGVVFLKKSRTQKLVSFMTNLATSNLVVGDLVRVVNEHLSFDGVLRVMDIKILPQGTIEISGVEHQASHYGIGATGNEFIKPILNLPDPTTCQPVTNLTAENKRI